jgi:hypothetical protein
MEQEEFGYDEESFDFEDDFLNYDTWSCTLCNKVFIDSEDYPNIQRIPKPDKDFVHGIEPRLYWLSQTEAVCRVCAEKANIPPIDKE